MPDVAVRINGKYYDVACEEGQEQHLQRLAQYVDDHVRGLTGAVSEEVSEAHLLVVACLILSDELFEARERATKAPAQEDASSKESTAEVPQEVIDSLAKRIVGIAERIKET